MKKTILTLTFFLNAALMYAQIGDFRFVLAGDTNLHQRLSLYDDPEFLEFFKRIQTADAAFLNIESQIEPARYADSPNWRSGGIYLASPEFILDEFKWAGFNLFSVANNHSLDYSIDGIRTSVQAIHSKGLVYAGAGENLALSRAPGYLDSKHGRVALIAFSSSLLPGSWAGEQRSDLPGRYGINPLRYRTIQTVPPDVFSALRKVAELRRGNPLPEDAKTLTLGTAVYGNTVYELGDKFSVRTEAWQKDVDELLASIRDARQQADYVIVVVHSHESSRTNPSQSADFLEDFAHKAIDEGADVFANHGPMSLRGIELYKGKPIFYGVGNFGFDGHVQPFQPAEHYTQRGLPQTATRSDFWITNEPDGRDNPIYGPWSQNNRESAVYELIFSPDGKLKQIAIDPISLLWAKGPDAEKTPETRAFRTRAGIPGPAGPEVAARVFERVVKNSAALGTTVTVKDGRGYVEIK